MSNAPSLHLCIATGQNLANLIPAVQCRAQEVWVLQTSEMKKSAGHLVDALKKHVARVARIDFDDSDVSTLNAQAAAIAERLDGRAVTINVTGGTKLMTIALIETLAAHLATGSVETRPHLVYTDTRHRRLDWLKPTPRSEAMVDVLRLNDILLAQGYRQKTGGGNAEAAGWQRLAEEREELTRSLGDRANELAPFFRTLNRLCHLALDEPRGQWQPEQKFKQEPRKDFAWLLRQAQKFGLLVWDGKAGVEFRDREAATYLGGGWVEEYAGLKVSGMKPPQWVPRLGVEHVDTKTPNELDAVVVHCNRLLIIECKAAVARDVDVADWIYKSSQLARSVGGQMAKPLLLSACPINDDHRKRAREYGVDVLSGAELASLPAYLRKWMN